ncbi:hypothetical protein ACFCZ1_22735 [Streptomyces sp. NPDC056224]|uniref:hypothetical protein n=1 Tax=Streptomyces sp. NPDC056224 TaxID=3345750 RepID=UPI0035DF288D
MDLTEACPGLITDAAGPALMHVLQSSHLVNDDAQTVGVTAMGKALEEAYDAGPKAGEAAVPPCTVTGIVGMGKRVGEIRLAAESRNVGAPGTGQTGVRVTRADKERGVAFDCVSTRVGSTRDMPLRSRPSIRTDSTTARETPCWVRTTWSSPTPPRVRSPKSWDARTAAHCPTGLLASRSPDARTGTCGHDVKAAQETPERPSRRSRGGN